MAKKKWPNWLVALLMFSPFVILFVIGFRNSKNSSDDLNKNGITTVGEVIRNYRIKSRGDFIEYQFYVNGKLYKDHQPVTNEVKKGKCYQVKYLPTSPENCEMILSKSVPCN